MSRIKPTKVMHTPGTWSVDETVSGILYIVSGDADKGTQADMAVMTDTWRQGGCEGARANARLMAAAPELLSALKDIVDSHELYEYYDDGTVSCAFCGRGLGLIGEHETCAAEDCMGVNARAAIAKALGEEALGETE